jgi:hypothetical protein
MVGTLQNYEKKNIDNDIPGPPTYFTRRRDGIPVPSMHQFMGGYNYLFTLKLSSNIWKLGAIYLTVSSGPIKKERGERPRLWHLRIIEINCTSPV